jgi:hypothetical protein
MVRSCRFYEKKFPDKDEVVMVNVRSIAEMGAYVTLLEYNNIEGMILLSELSRRRIRSINKLVRVGRNEAVMVLRVDQDKGVCQPTAPDNSALKSSAGRLLCPVYKLYTRRAYIEARISLFCRVH